MSVKSDVVSEDRCLRIILLGPPQVKWAGSLLRVPRRNVRALLYYLADQSRPVSRAQLCLLFWPDIPEENSRRNLTRLLTHLRRALPLPEALVVAEDRVSLDRTAFRCDTAEFRLLSGGGRRLDSLQRSAELYAGPFLAGFDLPGCPEYENWLTQERSALENRVLEVFSELIDIKIGEQDVNGAIGYAQRYLELDGLAEEIHRCLIALYALAGERARALRQYETCIAVLENELGARPLPETRTVYQEVLDGKQPQLRPEPIETLYPASLNSLKLDVPMVGRSAALGQLYRVHQIVKSGQSRLVLISGEAGEGKSRILYEYTRGNSLKNQVLFGAGQPGEHAVPYHPIVEALRSVSNPRSVSLPPFWLAEMIRLLPELRDRYPDLPPPLPLKGEEARLRLFDALCQYVFALYDELGPLVLCFDDLHWFDRTSLSWLVHLCRQLISNNRHIMVIGAYRKEEAEQVQDLREYIARLGILEEVKLEGLDVASVFELIQFLFENGSRSQSLASQLQEATGGNPFFILEILQTLGEEGKLLGNPDDGFAFSLPESVREVIGQRIGRLNPRCRQVLEAASVLDSPFRFKILQLTAGRSEMETAQSLDSLAARQLILEESGNYRFHHDLIRRVAFTGIGPIRLRLLHHRAGKALEKLEPGAVDALARHFDAGGEWQKALHYHDLSARKTEGLFAWQETEAHLKRMLALYKAAGPPENLEGSYAQQCQALAKLIHIHYLQGKLVERDEDLQRLEDLAGASSDPALHLQAIELRVRHLNNDARYREVIAEAGKGLALLGRHPDSSIRGSLQAQVGHAYQLLGQPTQALEVLQEAQSCISGDSDLELQAVVLDNLGVVHQMMGNYQQSLQYYQEAFACHQQLGDPYNVLPYLRIAGTDMELSRYAEAGQLLEEALKLSRKSGVRAQEGHALLSLSGWHVYIGDQVGAIDLLQQALEILETLRNQNLTASAKTSLGFTYYHLGDLVNGRKWLEDGLALLHVIGHKGRIALATVQYAVLETSAGHLSLAREKLQDGLSIARAVQYNELVRTGLICTAFLERQAGSFALAKENAEAALLSLHGLDRAGVEVWAHVEAGLALAEMGELEAAFAHTRAAVLLIPRAHQLWIDFEHLHLAHARVLRLIGEEPLAVEQERRARELFQSKAVRITDTRLRQQFCAAFERDCSNLVRSLSPTG